MNQWSNLIAAIYNDFLFSLKYFINWQQSIKVTVIPFATPKLRSNLVFHRAIITPDPFQSLFLFPSRSVGRSFFHVSLKTFFFVCWFFFSSDSQHLALDFKTFNLK